MRVIKTIEWESGDIVVGKRSQIVYKREADGRWHSTGSFDGLQRDEEVTDAYEAGHLLYLGRLNVGGGWFLPAEEFRQADVPLL